jgi:poly-gamma-glutamate synthesis protein (capsule biosynthesis protein)
VALLVCLPLLLSAGSVPGGSRDGHALAGTTGIVVPTTSIASGASVAARPTERRSITVALTGDVLIHNTVWQSARRAAARTGRSASFDFRPMLAPIRAIVAGADLAICHLEVPLAPPGGPYSGYPRFAAPQAIVPALRWTGYDACSTESNHSVDLGNDGLVRTLDALDRAGLRHTGTNRSRAEAARPVIIDVDGISVGWLEYTWGTNGIAVDADRPWSVDLIEPARILRDAHRARQHGADAVLVGLHWGEEYQVGPSTSQLALARLLAQSPDITLVYGHHAHVVQPIRTVAGTWVLFGLGNLLADQATIAAGVDRGVIALVRLTQDDGHPARVTRITAVPTRIDSADLIRVRPAGRAQVLSTGTS